MTATSSALRARPARSLRANCAAICAATCAALLLAACTGLPGRLESDVEAAHGRAEELAKSARLQDAANPRNNGAVVYDDGVWLGQRRVSLERAPELPAVFQENATFDRSVASLAEFAERIMARTGMPVQVTIDAAAAASASAQRATGGAGTGGGAAGGAAPAGGAGAAEPLRITWQGGSLRGLLDMVAARYGVSWRYADRSVVFFHTENRLFRIHALSGEASLQANVGGSGANASGSGSGPGASKSAGISTRSQAGFNAQYALWANMEKALNALLSPVGKMALSPETGLVTVTDTPAVLERVAQYIDTQNRSLTRQVLLNVTVLAVTLNDSDAYGIDWNLVYATASRKYGITTNLGLGSGSAQNVLSANVLNTSSSKLAGSNVLIQALSEQGKVRRETAAALTALNHQPVPVQVSHSQAYVSSVATNQVANAGVQTTITPDSVNTGFSMVLLPYILEDGNVILQFSTELSSLLNLREFSSGGNTVQLPEVDSRQFLQRVNMTSGQTLVISGFEQTDNNLQWSGVGVPKNIALGGSVKAAGNKEIIVIVVTPLVGVAP